MSSSNSTSCTPSTNREFDVIIFGSTGWAGRYAAEHLYSHSKSRWAICGRSEDKLVEQVSKLRRKYPNSTSKPTVLTADALSDASHLCATLSRAYVVVNCAGPFAILGRSVISACISTRTHYVDIAGEPVHILGSREEFHSAATRAKVIAIPAAGFDHVLADIGGYLHMSLILKRAAARADTGEGNGDLEAMNEKIRVTSFLTGRAGRAGLCVHVGTLSSALGGIQCARRSLAIARRLETRAGKVDGVRMQNVCLRDARAGDDALLVKLQQESAHVWHTLRCIDELRQEERERKNRECAPGGGRAGFGYAAYLDVRKWSVLIRLMISVALCTLMALLPGGRGVVERFPQWFTFGLCRRDGPSEKQILEASFEITYHGVCEDAHTGNEIARAVVKGTGPDPGYVATSKMALACAYTILEERDKLPEGGVFTPGSALFRTDIVSRLQELGAVKFETLAVSGRNV